MVNHASFSRIVDDLAAVCRRDHVVELVNVYVDDGLVVGRFQVQLQRPPAAGVVTVLVDNDDRRHVLIEVARTTRAVFNNPVVHEQLDNQLGRTLSAIFLGF